MENNSTNIKLQVEISYRQILKIALPIAASILVPQLNFITNNIFLGHLSEQALAIAGITGVYYLIFAAIGNGLNNGLQALLSRRAGENRMDEIGKLFHQSIFISFMIAFAGILITYFIAPFVLKHTLHNEENVKIAIHFLYIRIWGLPVLYIYQMRNALLVGINQSRFLVIGTFAETVTNIALDYCLIYGKFGLPEMGFNGAAIASVIAEFVGLIVIFGVMKWKGISQQLHLFKNIQFDKQRARLVLSQSLPLILQYAISIITWEFFYILIEHHGERSLAISNAMRNIFGLFGFLSWSFGAVANTMVSNIIGQGRQDKVMPLIKMILTLSVGVAVFLCLVLNLFPEIFLKIYGQDEDFIKAALPVTRVVSIALILTSLAVVWLNSVVGTGNSRINLYTEISAVIVYSIFAYTSLEILNLSITVGWMAEWVYWVTMLVPSYLYMMSGKWKGRKI